MAALTAKPCAVKHAAHQPHHRGLAAEQMHAAGDVEKQAVRGIERHQRSETVAPRRNGVQRVGIRGLVGIVHLHLGADGAGTGERQAGIEAETRGRVVERKDLQRVVLLRNDDAGFAVIPSPLVGEGREGGGGNGGACGLPLSPALPSRLPYREGPHALRLKTLLFVLTRFLYANRYPLRLKTLSHHANRR